MRNGHDGSSTVGAKACPWEERAIALAFDTLDASERDAVRAHLEDCDACLQILADAKRTRWRNARLARRAAQERQDGEAQAGLETAGLETVQQTHAASAAATLLALVLAHARPRRKRRGVHGAGAALPAVLHAVPARPAELEVQLVGRPYVDAVGTVHLHLRSADWSPAHGKLVHVNLGDTDVHVFGVPKSVDTGDWEVLFRLESIHQSIADLDIDPAIFSLDVHEA